jgi:hypothetical protein
MNIISDKGLISNLSTKNKSTDVLFWKSKFPEWNEHEQAQENLTLEESSSVNNNSAHRKVYSI